MKKILLALCCLAAMSLNSCFVDDVDDHSLSRQEIGQCLSAVKGNYTGKVLFESHNPDIASDEVDTLDIAWSITADTMIVINEFPQATILDRITEEPLKQALQEAAPTPLRAQLGFYQKDPIGFMLYPFSVIYDIEIDGTAHTASLIFWINSYSFGLYDSLSHVFQMKFQVAGLYLDEDTSHNYLTNTAYDNTSIPILITNANLSN